MLKATFVLIAGALLSACASLTPTQTDYAAIAGAHHFALASSDQPDAAPSEGLVVVTDRAMEAAPQATAPSAVLHRTSFGSPTRRQPDLRIVLATATDRARRRHARRRRAA
jgi:hypothetical protein